jgi:hypothetical protein
MPAATWPSCLCSSTKPARSCACALPPALEDAARKAFVQARFRPGEHAEHGVVKSRIRVEVVFEGGMPLRLG